ncbi:MAG TPA: glycosyltransferase family 9 protein [Stellaceae bacterium]|nr:glycosyltransferase family 9 protein [Stellaceae bacterium]
MHIQSILVYVSSGADDALGENIFKLPMVLALSEAFPEARISWVPGTSGSWFLQNQLAPLVGGRIHEFITDLTIPVEPWQALRIRHPFLRRWFDLIIDTQRYVGRTLFLRRVPHRLFISGTWRYFFSDRRPPRGVPLRPSLLVDKLLGLVAAATGRPVSVANPVPVPPPWLRRAAELLPAGPTYVGLAPGVGNMTSGRDWPFENFLAVARAQLQRGRKPVFILGPAERQWEAPLSAAVPGAVVPPLTGDPSGIDGPALTVALAGRLHAAVANDSGAGHLLGAGGAPVISLFGWSRPEKRAPFSRSIVVVRSQDFGSDKIVDIPVSAVIDAIERQIPIGPARLHWIENPSTGIGGGL